MFRRIADMLDRVEQHLEKSNTVLESFEGTLHTVATNQQQLDAAIAALQTQDTALAEEVQTLSTSVTNVTAYIASLQAQIAAGEPVDLTAELNNINALAAGDATLTTDVSGAVTGITAASTAASPAAPVASAPAEGTPSTTSASAAAS